MDYTPHTESDVAQMLAVLGLDDVEQLFDRIPDDLRLRRALDVPGPRSEPEVLDHHQTMAARNRPVGPDLVCFAGAGAYDHYVSPAVTRLAMQSEFATAYTSYQPEVSQGVLQALFEYQTMIAALAGMDVANASLYDGATACVEALNLARAVTRRDRVVVCRGLHPRWRAVIRTFAAGSGLQVDEAPLEDGTTDLGGVDLGDAGALLVGQPNYLGCLEDLSRAAAAAHGSGALLVVAFDPVSAGWLTPPGTLGADVVVGEGQCLGSPLSFGGPHLGIFATRRELIRRVPGRIVGETVDLNARRGYVLTLQAREQHIRREKASSNICTNQTLNAVAAAVHLAWLGPQGLRRVAEASRRKAYYLLDALTAIPGVERAYPAPIFREFALRLPRPSAEVLTSLAEEGFLGGVDLTPDYPELGEALLVAVTERRSVAELEAFAAAFRKAAA